MRIIIEVNEKTVEPPPVERLAPGATLIGATEPYESAGAAPVPIALMERDGWNIEATAVPGVATARGTTPPIDAGASPGGVQGYEAEAMPPVGEYALAAATQRTAAGTNAGAAPVSKPLAGGETYGAVATGIGKEVSAGAAPPLP